MDVGAVDTSYPYHRSVSFPLVKYGAPEEIRTPNLLIRSQMLYPLSYGRLFCCRSALDLTVRGGSGIRTREGA
jgi:hypothetical protein